MSQEARIRPRDRDAILQSLAAGVVPRRGQQYIQVGRTAEVTALLRDIERVSDGGSAVRFMIGQYGSGKTFLLHLVRSIALEKGLVTMHADLTPDRRLYSTGDHSRALFAELARNLATRTRPDGGAMASVVERFVSSALVEAREKGVDPTAVMRDHLDSLSEMVNGYEFASIIETYWEAHDNGNEQLKSSVVRWMRAEYGTRTEARQELGVRTIIDGSNFYDQLKLMARFVQLAGYRGIVVVLDEMVNLYKLANTQARRTNFEQILRIVNDCLQGAVEHLGFVMAGTPEFLMDTRRGLYSYEALQTRLAENQFAADGLRDLSGPVIRMNSLTPEELYVLLTKIRYVHASGTLSEATLPDQALEAYMRYCSERIGATYFQTPRNTIKGFVQLLEIIDQNPGVDWRNLLGMVQVEQDADQDYLTEEVVDDDELTSFRL